MLIKIIKVLNIYSLLKDTLHFTLEDSSHQNLLPDGKKKKLYLSHHRETIEFELHSHIFLLSFFFFFFPENRLILSSDSTGYLFHYKIYRMHNRLVETSAVLLPNPEISIVGLHNHIFWILHL